jgi:hypothetical protein
MTFSLDFNYGALNGRFNAATFPPKRQMTEEKIIMKAIVVTDQAAGTAGMKLVGRPEPQAAINDVVVQVHASGYVPTELTWPSPWTDRLDRDRTPVIPGQELAGVVTALGYGTTGLSMGQRVFGLTDSYRGGTLAEYVAVEARNLAPLPGDVDFTVGASVAMPGLTAWQGLFEHGRLRGRAADRQTALGFGAQEFVDLENDALEDVGEVDLCVRCHRRRHREAVSRRHPGWRNTGVHRRPGRGAACPRPGDRLRSRVRSHPTE